MTLNGVMALFCVISANSGSFRAHCVNVHVRYLISWWVLVSGENLAILRLHGWLMVGWSLVFAEIEQKTWHFCFRSKILRIGRRHCRCFCVLCRSPVQTTAAVCPFADYVAAANARCGSSAAWQDWYDGDVTWLPEHRMNDLSNRHSNGRVMGRSHMST